MGTLYMVRHGQASFGSRNYDRLSPTGIAQSRILADHLAAIDLRPDALYCGDMARQRQTARAMIDLGREKGCPLPEIRIEPAFNEYPSGSIIEAYIAREADADPLLMADLAQVHRDRKAFQRLFEKILVSWVKGAFAGPGIVTWEAFRERVADGLRRVVAQNGRGRSILVCTSGGPISAAVQTALGLSDENALRVGWQIANGSVTKFLYDGTRLTLAGFNAIDHLRLRKDPALVTYR
jgi:broad specificity phosphatase PhoE